jgi:hypothetical protein
MNDKLLTRLLACVCVTSLAIAAATGPFASAAGRAVDSAAKPVVAAQSPRAPFDVSPFPAPRIDPSLPAPEPAPTF